MFVVTLQIKQLLFGFMRSLLRNCKRIISLLVRMSVHVVLYCRVAELQAAIAEQSRRREEAIHALETMQREREHAAEVERSKLQAKLTDVSEDVTRKIMARDMKLREETQDRFGQLQQVSTIYSTLIHTPFHLSAVCSHLLLK